MYYHFHRGLKQTDAESVKATISAVEDVWNNSKLLTTTAHASTKLRALVKGYRDLIKNKNRKSPKSDMQREMFLADIQEIFDVTHSKALVRNDIPLEDRRFVLSQREDIFQLHGQRGLPVCC